MQQHRPLHDFHRAYALAHQQFPDIEDYAAFRLERELLDEIDRAFEELDTTIQEIAGIGGWNFPNLKRVSPVCRRIDDNPHFRKPRLVLDADITTKGNLSLTWRPADGHMEDTAYGYYYNAKAAFDRPRNELVFIRGFSSAFRMASHPDFQGCWDRRRLCCLVNLVRLLVDHAARRLAVSCDVEMGRKLHVDFVSHDLIQVHVETDERRAKRLSYVPDAIDDVAGKVSRTDFSAFEERYGISCEMFIGFVKATRRYRMPIAVMAQILHDQYGLRSLAWSDGFQRLIDVFEVMCYIPLIGSRTKAPFAGMSLDDIKALFACSFPDRKSWHVGDFVPSFDGRPVPRLPPAAVV